MNYIHQYPLSAVLYIVVFLINAILSKLAMNNKSKKKSFLLLIIIIFTFSILSGIRAESVGTDTANYVSYINNWTNYGVKGKYPTEPGFLFIIRILSVFSNKPSLVLIIISLLINFLIISRLWSYKSYISFNLSIIIYSLSYYFMTFSGIRQWLAISITFWGSKYIVDKKYWNFLLIAFIAMLFHNTAIIVVSIPLLDIILSQNKFKKNIALVSIITSMLTMVTIIIPIIYKTKIISQYKNYLYNIEFNNSNSLLIWVKLIIALLIYLIVFNKKNINHKSYLIHKRFFNIYFTGLILSIPGYYISNLARIGLYFTIYDLFLYSGLVQYKKNIFVRILLIIILILLFYSYYKEIQLSGRGQMPFIPYWKSKVMK